jgi:hypothetical protein
MFAYLSLAQHNAIVAAEDAKERGTHASLRAAVAGASAEILRYVFPTDAGAIETLLRAQQAADQSVEKQNRSFAIGESVGRAVGAAVVERARVDGFVATWTGQVPVCDGCWFSSANPPAPPVLPLLGQMHPFFLASGDQFRPPPPPTFGQPDFVAALQEVRRISDARTDEQRRVAQFWVANSGAFWDSTAAELIGRYHLDERRGAHAFALMQMATMDALIACAEAKFVYWTIRPSQADPGIVPIGLPNFPSYPSNHACASGTAAGILADLFPAERDRLLAIGEEAAISRLYGGIHYRFDLDAGKEIARNVIALARELDPRGHEPFPF